MNVNNNHSLDPSASFLIALSSVHISNTFVLDFNTNFSTIFFNLLNLDIPFPVYLNLSCKMYPLQCVLSL